MTTTDPNAARNAARAQLTENQRTLYELVERIASDMAELAENIRGRRRAAMEGRTTDLSLVIRVSAMVTNALSNAGLGLLTDRLGAVMAVQRELAVMEAAETPTHERGPFPGISAAKAKAIYDVLVAEVAAPDDERGDFVRTVSYMTSTVGRHEVLWRFPGGHAFHATAAGREWRVEAGDSSLSEAADHRVNDRLRRLEAGMPA